MNEIAKCPRCGETPKRIQYKAGGFGHSCCGAEFFCTTYWNQYAAAMELAKAEVAASNAVWSVPLERLEPAVEAAEDMLFQAKMRVLEVFGK